jgi:hypothetical protein
MRITGVFIAALFLVALLTHEQAAAQSDRKKAATPGNIVAPKGAVFAPSKMAPKPSNNTAPRPIANAPLSAGECKGLGGKVESGGLACLGTGGGGQQCVTVDEHGVVRRKCLTRQ